jgi:hypothetical protein
MRAAARASDPALALDTIRPVCHSGDMSDTQTEAPIMVRVDITRDELRALKMQALAENKSLRAYLGDVLREKLS